MALFALGLTSEVLLLLLKARLHHSCSIWHVSSRHMRAHWEATATIVRLLSGLVSIDTGGI
jgi:hypothetical protein